MKITSLVDEGLGHSSYLVELEGGRALVVDPARIPDAQVATARAQGLEIAYTADTHSHADYVSGSPVLAAAGATFLAPEAAHLDHPHRPVEPGEEIPLGDFVLRAIPTPGHTPEHLAYLLCDGDTPVALFSGGSLMVGTVGRTDLLGAGRQEALARRLYRALRDEILTLPDDLPVYPTHGAGSFCSAPGASQRTTTIGLERANNPLLRAPDEDSFVEQLISGFGTFPTYFSLLPALNQRGTRLYSTVPVLPRLSLDNVDTLVDDGATIADARPIAAFAAGHIPGALSNALRPVFASWLGWLVDPHRTLVFVLDDHQDRTDLVRQCLNIGHDQLAGELDGGMTTWHHAGRAADRIELVAAAGLPGTVVDVRQAGEFATGHVPGALNVELGSLDAAVDTLPAGRLTVACGHGERAMTGASILARAGRSDLGVLEGGPDDVAAARGVPLAVGP